MIRFVKGIRHRHVIDEVMRIVQLLTHFVLRGNSHLFVHTASGSLIMHTMILLLICLKVPSDRLLLLVKLSEELFILEDGSLLSFVFLLLSRLLSNNLGSRNTGEIVQRPRFEPAVRDVQLPLDLFPHTVHFINRKDKLGADGTIVVLSERPALILSEVITIETVLEGE